MPEGEPTHAEMIAAFGRFVKDAREGYIADVDADDVSTLERVLAHLERTQWRPIEEAPKDGTPIILLSKAYTDPGDPANAVDPVHHPARCSIGAWWPEGDSWTDQYGSLEGEDVCQLTVTGVWLSGGGWFQPNEVTHWQPLPLPPSPETPRND